MLQLMKYGAFFLVSLFAQVTVADTKPPVLLGLSAGFGIKNNSAAQSIEKGILLAVDEINSSGGVLGGRMLRLVAHDDRGLPSRAEDLLEDFAANPNVVAVFTGLFSPVVIATAPIANARKILLLAPWSAADSITQHPYPNYVFRVSLTDSWAMQVMLDSAHKRGLKKIALFVPNTAWGRSCEQALMDYQKRIHHFEHLTIKYNFGEADFRQRIKTVSDFHPDAVILVSNETEGAPIIQQFVELPESNRIPVIAHWGILGGDFPTLVGDALNAIDFTLISTFTFEKNTHDKTKQVSSGFKRVFNEDATQMLAQPGFAHAYDLTHMLAIAINRAGSGDRAKVRDAFEALDTYHGLVRDYRHPFSKTDHEGLDKQQVFIGRFDHQGKVRKTTEK